MIRSPLAALLVLAAYLLPLGPLSASTAAAQALVQVRMAGVVNGPADDPSLGDGATASLDRSYGHLVEIEVDAAGRGSGPAEVVLHLHVAHGTTGAELLQLTAARLQRLGVAATLTGVSGANAPGIPPTSGSLWIEGAMRVHLRMGGGLIGEISCVEGPPAAMRLIPGDAIEGGASVSVTASTAIVMPGRRPIRGRATFQAALTALENSAEAATALWTAAKDRWVSERPGTDTWRPIKMASGATITGVSVRVTGQSDWGLEVSL